jgi:hypothetical protein
LRHRPPGVGVVLLADLDQANRPRESRLVGVRRVAAADENTPLGVEPALGVVVYVLAYLYPFALRPPGFVTQARARSTGCPRQG